MNGRALQEDDARIIDALLRTIPNSRWEAVAIAKGIKTRLEGRGDTDGNQVILLCNLRNEYEDHNQL